MPDSSDSSPAIAEQHLAAAIVAIPPGRWAVGVSGGADSVALLMLLRKHRPDLPIHIVHLDHETREGGSAADAQFVADLVARVGFPATIETRSAVESEHRPLERNTSARFRAARLALFSRVVAAHGLDGVILAHHADDQAETVLHRLLRGSGPSGLAGMSPRTRLRGMLVLRPLLRVRSHDLRTFLHQMGQSWRDDASNMSEAYLRNRLRRLLAARPALTDALLHLSLSCDHLRDWLQAQTPPVQSSLQVRELLNLPAPLQRHLAQRWLAACGVPPSRLEPAVVRRLIAMAEDAATPARQSFPGGVFIRRTRGTLSRL